MGVLRWDSRLPWTVPPVPWYSGIPWAVPPVPCYSGIGRTVGYGGPQVGQWTPMDSPTCPMVQWTPMDSSTCPMVQWDRTDSGIWGSSGGTVDSHGQSHLSHGTVG